MKLMSLLPKRSGYSSLSWHESQAVKGVRFATRRISLSQRIELTKRVRELTLRHEFMKSGDASDQLEAALSDLLVRKLYLEWGLIQVEGLAIDGQHATASQLIEKGPEQLSDEIIAALRAEIGLSEEERKNF
jgi:hypothetical protein